jgi:hypothetical protein
VRDFVVNPAGFNGRGPCPAPSHWLRVNTRMGMS